jgi:hypothetical protein
LAAEVAKLDRHMADDGRNDNDASIPANGPRAPPALANLFADGYAFVDGAVHGDAARARTRRTGAALRASAEKQNRGSDGEKKFHDSVFLQRQTLILAWRPGAPRKAGRAATHTVFS